MERKKQLYFKLFWMYAMIVCFVVAVLVTYFVVAFKKNLLENRQQEAEAICQNMTKALQEQKDVVDYLYSDLYRNRQELDDVLAYLELDEQSYWNHRLDQYAASNSANYDSLQTFVNNAFEVSQVLDRIELISYTTMEMTVYQERATVAGQDGRERIERLESEKVTPEEIIFQREVRDPDTLQSKGCMIFTFHGSAMFQDTAQNRPWLDVLVTQDYLYPVMNFDGFARWKDKLLDKQQGKTSEMISYEMYQDQMGNYQVFVFLNQIRASELSWQAVLMIAGVGLAVLAGGVLCVSIYIRSLTHRVDAILAGMDAVKTGDLTVRLTASQGGDELDMIASDFNDMCDKLREHIRRQYLAEIEKKNSRTSGLAKSD